MTNSEREFRNGQVAGVERISVLGERGAEASDGLSRLTSFALNRVREAAYLIDPDGRFIYINREASRMLAYDHSQLLRMTVMDIDPEWDRQRWRAGWDELRHKGSLL